MRANDQQETVHDSPTGWVASHIKSYVETGGATGHRHYGNDALLLTTRGRKSGKLRRTALYYGQDGDRFLVVASAGGAAEHPSWYLNLLAEPSVRVQVKDEVFAARARTATAEEKPPLWEHMVGRFPTYQQYQKKTGRDIPVVIIERTSTAA